MAGKKSEWFNHLIAFLSTVVGILIALQLDEWREEKEVKDRVEKSIQSIDEELTRNRHGLRNVVAANRTFIKILQFIVDHERSGDIIQYNESDLDILTTDDREHLKIERIGNENNFVLARTEVIFDIFLTYRIEIHHWESLKFSGYLPLSDRSKIANYIYIYNLLNTDFGGYDVMELSEKIGSARSNQEILVLLKNNIKPYETKLNYLEDFLRDKGNVESD